MTRIPVISNLTEIVGLDESFAIVAEYYHCHVHTRKLTAMVVELIIIKGLGARNARNAPRSN